MATPKRSGGEPEMTSLNSRRLEGEPARLTGSQLRSGAIRLIASAVVLWAMITAIGYVLTHWLNHSAFERWDLSVDRWFVGRRTQSWNDATQVGSHAAETITVIALAVVLVVGLRFVLGTWDASLFLALAVIGEVAIFVCVTLVIDRPRPEVAHLDTAPPTSSFPSGHVAAAVALYGALAVVVWSYSRREWLRAGALAIAIAVPIVVGLSRLYRGMHYPTDVLAGALLGALWLITVSLVLMRPRSW
jgi:membrane-associated phospholipid phosphatase